MSNVSVARPAAMANAAYRGTKENLRSDRGAGVIQLILVLAVVVLLMEFFLLAMMQNHIEDEHRTFLREMKLRMISSLSENARNELTLKNSRFSVNSVVDVCLKGTGSCDETTLYDVVLFSPAPPYSFTGNWPPPPPGLIVLAGGLATNKALFNVGGGQCRTGATDLSTACPLQAVSRIRPLCGGTLDAPDFSVPGGAPCTGRATGFEVIVGVASFWNGVTHFNQTLNEGDLRSFRVSARVFMN